MNELAGFLDWLNQRNVDWKYDEETDTIIVYRSSTPTTNLEEK